MSKRQQTDKRSDNSRNFNKLVIVYLQNMRLNVKSATLVLLKGDN